MGADLYIKNLRRHHVSKSSKRKSLSFIASETSHSVPVGNGSQMLEAYFRDPYNLNSVLPTLGLSWWKDVLPLLNKDSELRGQSLKQFRSRVKRAKQCLATKEELQELGVRLEPTGERSIEDFHRRLVEKRKELLLFLDLAIRNDLARVLLSVKSGKCVGSAVKLLSYLPRI